jgi:hypothetical protein
LGLATAAVLLYWRFEVRCKKMIYESKFHLD